jgi:hypothetical protein
MWRVAVLILWTTTLLLTACEYAYWVNVENNSGTDVLIGVQEFSSVFPNDKPIKTYVLPAGYRGRLFEVFPAGGTGLENVYVFDDQCRLLVRRSTFNDFPKGGVLRIGAGPTIQPSSTPIAATDEQVTLAKHADCSADPPAPPL